MSEVAPIAPQYMWGWLDSHTLPASQQLEPGTGEERQEHILWIN